MVESLHTTVDRQFHTQSKRAKDRFPYHLLLYPVTDKKNSDVYTTEKHKLPIDPTKQKDKQKVRKMIIRRFNSLLTVSLYIFCLSSLLRTTAFTGRETRSASKTLLHSTPDNAAAMTEFMAKAHEEKVRAMARVEDKYRGQITELEERIAELEGLPQQAAPATPTSGNSYSFPATNKDLTDKVQSYRTFISDYIVKAQEEKASAVKAAEAKLTAKYESIIEGLKAEGK